jgi:hypothetical protein
MDQRSSTDRFPSLRSFSSLAEPLFQRAQISLVSGPAIVDHSPHCVGASWAGGGGMPRIAQLRAFSQTITNITAPMPPPTSAA